MKGSCSTALALVRHSEATATFPWWKCTASQVFPPGSHPREQTQNLPWEFSLLIVYLHSPGIRVCWWEGEGQ